MADAPTAPPTGDQSPASTPPSPPPWHQGVEADILGTWQNKGYPLDDPKKIAIEATKAYREAQGKLGIPANEILRMIKPDSQPAEIKSFWNKLGAPDKPEGYDFSGIKFADGSDLDAPLVDTLRSTFDSVHLPKDAATAVTQAIVKFMDGAEAEDATTKATKLQAERAEIQREWAKDYDANLFIAKQGAKALGVDPQTFAKLEETLGYAGIMRAMHKIGILNKEDRFISGGQHQGPMTSAQAQARKTDLMNDKGWVKRYMDGDVSARQEMSSLNQVITGIYEAA